MVIPDRHGTVVRGGIDQHDLGSIFVCIRSVALTTDQVCQVRRNLSKRADELGISLADLSRAAGRNAAYIQQFVERGSPRVLPEDVRLAVAMRLRMDERLLGARDPWTPPQA